MEIESSEVAETTAPLWAMVIYAICVGVIGGLAAWIFRVLIGLVHNLLFNGVLSADYDMNVHAVASPWGAGVILVPVVGAIFVTWLVQSFAPEAKGHGVPEVMHAIHNEGGRIRPRVAVVKALASAISIGSGGSVGREGPIVQIGSAFGSMLGQWMPTSHEQRALLIACGAGGGIAATFNAPLGGALFAVELLMMTVNVRALSLLVIATMIATSVGSVILGDQPSFVVPTIQSALPESVSPGEFFALALLGVVSGGLSAAFIKVFYWTEDAFGAAVSNPYLRHCLGMFIIGVMIYAMMIFAGHYYVQGVGYATVVEILAGALADPWFLLLLFGLKFMATCLSLGSGASGGVFSPTLFLGATSGAAFAHLIGFLGLGIEPSPVLFAVAGMAAAVAGATGALLTGIVIISEMTADFGAMPPLLLAAGVAAIVRSLLVKDTLYTMKLTRRGEFVPQGLTSERPE